MSHTRRNDQSVDAFSLPTDLLNKAKSRAAELKMTKSGFYRYCLAKELGFTETQAMLYAEHRAVLNSVDAVISENPSPEAASEETTSSKSALKIAAIVADRVRSKRKR